MLLACMAPINLAFIAIRDPTFQPCALVASMNGLYTSSFVCIMTQSRSLSCVTVNSMI